MLTADIRELKEAVQTDAENIRARARIAEIHNARLERLDAENIRPLARIAELYHQRLERLEGNR